MKRMRAVSHDTQDKNKDITQAAYAYVHTHTILDVIYLIDRRSFI